MKLEDHVGDVIRKARQAANVAPAIAAPAAALDEAGLQDLEQTGKCTGQPNWERLAATLQLDGKKLAGLAHGWHPAKTDLTTWRELRMITTFQDENSVNCYLVWDEVSREAALFDTGWDATPILEIIRTHQLELKHLFLTHTHEDHIAAMGALREHFPKLHLHTNSKTAPPQHRNRANDFLHLGNLRITNRNTPGHAEDGVIYIVGNWPEDAAHVALVGDTLFAGSMATGLQSFRLLKEKIVEQIFSLPGETLICPGHGPVTTLREEKEHNAFFGV